MKLITISILIIAAAILFIAQANAEEFRNVRETEITPTEAHYDDSRLLNLDAPLYRCGEVVTLIAAQQAPHMAIVWDYASDGREWFYTLRSAKFSSQK